MEEKGGLGVALGQAHGPLQPSMAEMRWAESLLEEHQVNKWMDECTVWTPSPTSQ